MSLKEKLDQYRETSPSRFTEAQRKVMGDFQRRMAAAVRKAPRVGDRLPPLALERGRTFGRLALLFFRGAW